MRVVVRSAVRRCAWCHDEVEATRACTTCLTGLHPDCWLEAGRCPTLGCSPPARVPDASRLVLAVWLATLGAGWFGLARVLPAFDRVFREVGVDLPWLTEALLALGRAAAHPAGTALFAAGALASVAAGRRAGATALRTLTVAGWLTAAVGVVALFLALAGTLGCQKL